MFTVKPKGMRFAIVDDSGSVEGELIASYSEAASISAELNLRANKEVMCIHCLEAISETAKTCPNCGGAQ